VHFVALDSNCAIGLASADRCTLAAQKKWLEEDLAASDAAWTVVFFHHPPWSSGDHGSQLKMRREFAPLFEKYGVDLVLTGHDHHYERSYPMRGDAMASSGGRGVPYLVVGSGGASLRPFSGGKPSWTAVRTDNDHGYLDVRVEEGTLTAQVLTPSGKLMDSFTLTKELPAASAPTPAQPGTPAPSTPPVAEQPGSTSPGTPSRDSVPTSPELPGPPGAQPGDLGQGAAGGCSAGPVAALFPAGALLLAGALRRRRRPDAR
jgi:uncharacterized protein (TIGR03382 family)